MSRNIAKPCTTLARRSTTRRQVANPGVAKLRKDADNKIQEHSTEIAQALVDGAKEGNASSARLLVDLADGANWIEHADSVAQVLSLAMSELNKEPPTIQLDITTNPPKLMHHEVPQLTDGNHES